MCVYSTPFKVTTNALHDSKCKQENVCESKGTVLATHEQRNTFILLFLHKHNAQNALN